MPQIVRLHETGAPDVLKLAKVEVPPPASDEVRIAVKAIGSNRAESMFCVNFYIETPEFPAKLGYEATGIVVEVGKDVEGLERQGRRYRGGVAER